MIFGFLKFDLGESFFYNKDVWELMKEKLPVSISLGLWRFHNIFSFFAVGNSQGCSPRLLFDLLTSLAVIIGYAIPGFV